MSIIYIITNKITNKSYIGQTQKTMNRRWIQHTSDSKKIRSKFYNSIRKYGIECWNLEILEEVQDINLLNEREIYWIAYYNTFNNGYNSNTGGKQKTVVSDEVKKKISKSNTGKIRSEEYKQNMSKIKSGKNHSNYGKTSATKNRIWINNSIVSKMVSKDFNIKNEWIKGRIRWVKNPGEKIAFL